MTYTNLKNWPNKTKLKIAAVIVVSFLAGYLIRGSMASGQSDNMHTEVNHNEEQTWICPMHPQIRQPKQGKCPICFMDLVPVESNEQAGATEISFSENALKLMEIQTSPVERKWVEAQIRMLGKLQYDETRLKHITAWVNGRIDKLYVDFTGTKVIKGDHMVYLYSPELISAQAEFLQTAKSAKNIKPDSSDFIKRSTQEIFHAAKEKLALLGLTQQQIEGIEISGTPSDHIIIYAPVGGVVLDKHVNEGAYVQTGTKIYTIADLSQLWLQLDAYESDIMWVRYGQEVEFTTQAYPGEIFKGQITFISPIVDPKTRTIKLRVNVSNKEGKLKPDMFAKAVVRSKVASAGLIMDASLSGKWICPMHPSVVKEDRDSCDICGMDLVTTESLGYIKADSSGHAPLVIPATAPLITGKRAVVYVRIPNAEKPTFEGREVVLGPRTGDYYIVKSGLSEGEIVVTNGNFKIDSALQIQAKPSMMNPDGGIAPMQHQDSKEQVLCPVMGGKINKKYFVEHKGKKVYFCCPGCEKEFLKEPEKYMDKLPQFKDANLY